MLSVYAKMAAEHPELIDAYREALKTSSTLMLSNCPELINEFRRLAGDLDAFLMACKTGEIVPQDFIKKTTHLEEK